MSVNVSPPRSTTKVSFYGGAIEAELNINYKDVSEVRPVPDHQEVYISHYTLAQGVEASVSLIIEILDPASIPASAEGTMNGAIMYYFEDIVETNEADSFEVLSQFSQVSSDSFGTFMPSMEATFSRFALVGKQRGCASTANEKDVDIILVLVRLANVGTDILFTLHVPTSLQFADSHTAEKLVSGIEGIGGDSSGMMMMDVQDKESTESLGEKIASDFRTLLDTFKIVDWSLFST